MESSSLFASSLPSLTFSSKKLHSRKLEFVSTNKRSSPGITFCTRRDSFNCNNNDNYGELLVNESMVVLRKRIHEMKMIERNYEPPAGWMEWEKQCYASYDQFICNFVGFLQMHLMNTRPSLALGLLFLLTMSVPISTATIALQLMQASSDVVSTIHFG